MVEPMLAAGRVGSAHGCSGYSITLVVLSLHPYYSTKEVTLCTCHVLTLLA